jgi:hypothetical protein
MTDTNVLAAKIERGHAVTWEYRQWCDSLGLTLTEGLTERWRPDPFPMMHPMVCRHCGHYCSAATVLSHMERVFSGRHQSPGLDEPDQYETFCSECGRHETFVPAVVCSECREFPCVCDPADAEYVDRPMGVLMAEGGRSYPDEKAFIPAADAAVCGAGCVRAAGD